MSSLRIGRLGRVVLILVLATAAAACGGVAPSPSPASGAVDTSAATIPRLPSPPPAATASATQSPTSAPTVKPTQALITMPTIVSFKVPATADCRGYILPVTVKVSWVVARATGVAISIDGPGIYTHEPGTTGSVTVPFACGQYDAQHTYTLTTTGGTGVAASQTKTVKRIN
jgi:hypothetical protein